MTLVRARRLAGLLRPSMVGPIKSRVTSNVVFCLPMPCIGSRM
jgi:hypothetical protein